MQNRLEADLARLGTGKNVPSGLNLAAKLDPRWRQDGLSYASDNQLDELLGPSSDLFRHLRGDVCKKCGSVKTNNTRSFFMYFWVLGGLVGGSWGVF